VRRSYYSAPFQQFLNDSDEHVLGALAKSHHLSLDLLQTNAWRAQIQIFRRILGDGELTGGYLFFEFAIPRMGKRVDVILIYRGLVLVLEFKVGERDYPKHALDQVVDYGLDLKNFHAGSHGRPVVPILVCTEAERVSSEIVSQEDGLYRPLLANSRNLAEIINGAADQVAEPEFDPKDWANSPYKPTPTIIEAAQALYRGHNVKEISRSDSGAINLSRTAAEIGGIIDRTKEEGSKSICFITGVPGSGKTLAGLNIANERHNADQAEHAVFLSGNGPLVSVLREALARDEVDHRKLKGEASTKKEALSRAQAFIQNIHHFRDDALASDKAPIERVVVFDEAQRAWTMKHTAKFMKDRGIAEFTMSEPEFLISVMNRHEGYAVIVCIVGGGQEINTGEAGLPEWFNALGSKFSDWNVYVSDRLEDFEYTRGYELYKKLPEDQVTVSPNLHLAVSVRSYRAELVSDFVKQLLDGNVERAAELHLGFSEKYPIVLTRNLETARNWLRSKARGTERFGLVASSGALRLKPLGILIKGKIDPAVWFLKGQEDVRSSFYLEDAATEFDIQGLELDWTCIAWDGNFYRTNDNWNYRKFSGTRWQVIRDDLARIYLKNAYRVLLTRARQGMVIFVPEGSTDDPTRTTEYYDGTFDYLCLIGLPVI